MERNRRVDDYFDLLKEETGLILVGGQAVNLWAERYQAKDTSISAFQPFTSIDADFYRRTAKIQLPPNWTAIPVPSKGGMRLVTHALRGPNGQPAEVLRSVKGLTEDELKNGAISIQYEDGGSTWFLWFLPPPLLFQAKLANVNDLDQADRQDLKHLKLLVPINRCFFADLLEHIPSVGRPGKAIDWLQQHCHNVRNAVKQKHLSDRNWNAYLPLEAVNSHPNESLQNFVIHQLQNL